MFPQYMCIIMVTIIITHILDVVLLVFLLGLQFIAEGVFNHSTETLCEEVIWVRSILWACSRASWCREGRSEEGRDWGREGTKKDIYMLHMEKLIVQKMILIVQVQCSDPIGEFLAADNLWSQRHQNKQYHNQAMNFRASAHGHLSF